MENEIEFIFPASSLQQGFIYHALSQTEDDAYRVQILYDYHEALNIAIYIKAWEYCIAQYPTLRTAFNWEEDIIQIIYKQGKLDYHVHDISHLSSQQERDAAIENIQIKDRKQGFDLTQPTLLRLHIIKQTAAYYTVLKTEHHSIADGWSEPILLTSLHHYYKELINNKIPNIKEDTAYLEAQEYINRHKSTIQDYWKITLAEVDSVNDINAILSTQIDVNNYKQLENPASSTLEIKGDFYDQLKVFTLKEGITINVLVQFIWHKLLHVYSNSLKSIVGTTVSGRDLPIDGIIESVGLYINTLPLIINWENNNNIKVQLHEIQKKITELNTHSFAELAKLQKDGERIFHSLFVYENYPAPKGGNDSAQISFRNSIEKVDYPLSVIAYEQDNSLTISLNYDNICLTENKAQQHLVTLKHIVHQILENPNKLHNQISLLEPEAYKKIIYDWNATDKDYAEDKTIYQLFQEQVAKTPNNIALVYEQEQLTYAELNEKSNRLARHIRAQYEQRTKQTLSPDTLIALCLDRSLEMIIGIMAVLKAGGAYVPIDPNYPQDRIDYILEDTQAKLILSQRYLSEHNQIQLPQDKIIYIDLSEKLYNIEDTSNLPQHSKSNDIAYVIYTSGTTGKPKGVMVEHKSISSKSNFYQYEYGVSHNQISLFYRSYGFDGSIEEYLIPLLHGAKTIIYAPPIFDLSLFINIIKEKKITKVNMPPQLLYKVIEIDNSVLDNLKILISGGDKLDFSVLHQYNYNCAVYNSYGPTECTIDTHIYKVNYLDKTYKTHQSCIGKNVFDCKSYVLDSANNPVPIGVTGELYIGGAGLARGYLNSPELTAERFISNPFATESDKAKGYTRLYKTGDLVKWLPDGNVEYIGRNDDQVKIRGYRIELGEIEHALTQIQGIKQACVLANERKTETSNHKYLVAYYVLDNRDTPLTSTTILDKLSQALPTYMIPDALIAMESFPLTINGKLDKRALPQPDLSSAATYIAPTLETEALICKIWQEVLGVERVGITDNFFRIGGNSILAIQVSHRMTKALGHDVKVADIFKYKTIAQLHAHSLGKAQILIPKIHANQAMLSFAQERLWFIEQYEQGTNAYHIPEVFELAADTRIEAMQYALQQIVSRHEILRTTIEQGIQKVHNEPLYIEEIRLTDQQDYHALIKEHANHPFDLSRDYPIRVKFYIIESSTDPSLRKTLLLINTHHIASDGWSGDIFQRELFLYYEAYINKDTTFSLPALEIQYKDYAVWQKTYLTGDTLAKQLSYWKNTLTGYQPLAFPTDYARPNEINYRGAHHRFTLNKEITQQLRALAQAYGVTLHSVLLSSITILLSKYTGQDDIVMGSPIANRHHMQTEGLIGFFVNMLVNRTLLHNTQSFEALIQQVQQQQIEAQNHQDLPFEKLVDELAVERDPARHPIFQIMFGVQSFGGEDNASDQQKNYLKPYQVEDSYEIEKFDLSITIEDTQQATLVGQISYATSLFHKDTITRLVDHYTHLLTQLTEAPKKAYSACSLLNTAAYKKIIYDWNATDKDYPSNKTIHQLFQEQVAKTPNNIALVYEDQQLTYKQLNEKSNQLAHHLSAEYEQRTKQVLSPDTLIALCLDRGLEMVIGILAVLKAGGAYVPIDPSYPQQRINYILEDTQAAFILSQRHLIENNQTKLPQDKVIYIDLIEKLYQQEETSNLVQYSKASDLAYVIYTSGTTGKPKGVMVEHKGIINLIQNQINYFDMKPEDNAMQFAAYVFDASVSELFTAITIGAKLSIVPNAVKQDVQLLSDYIADHQIHVATLPPSLLSAMAYKDYASLKTLIVAGEACPTQTMRTWSRGRRFINAYGPTEGTVCAMMHRYEQGDVNTNVGKAIDNIKVYVLDPNNNPVPIGVVGELYIGGAGLARGYVNNKALTAERFIANPFATEVDRTKGYTRLYKTGDLVRWLPDGNIEYIGRNDDQVKIRGYRIELGEIEHALTQIQGIKQACVLTKERKTETSNHKYLVAYYVLDDKDTTLTTATILEKLSQVLPEYMVPNALVAMESFPLTINGKLDKQALPDPEFSNEANYVKPETELEVKLCEIYAETLGLTTDQISTHQSFFRMGGNSILSIQLKQKLNQLHEFKHISVADLFKFNTIHKLIQNIQQNHLTSYKLQQTRYQSNDHEIAIIGISGAFSGASNITAFWQLISHQQEGIQFYNREECIQLGVDEALLADPNYIAVAGAVKDIELFDPMFWDISPNEAKQLDPQIRKFIEHCWFVLESSGYAHQRKNYNIGVFAGSGHSNYFYDHIVHGEMADQINMWEASASNSKDALATKTAFLLGLTGSANSINTACSTGLVSVVEACQKLRLSTCDMALAGGVSLSLPDEVGYIYQEGMVLSKDGHCKTFDKEASGTTAGSGVGVVLLKRLGDAVKDGDTIIGVIKGYATNNDGDRKTGYTAPSVIGQSECIINAQRMAGIIPDQIDYVECHGTATHLGDSIEVQALKEAFTYNQPKENSLNHKTVLGAVKANIGHSDSAAGTAGLIKVCAMLQHNTIPGQVNFHTANPELHIDQTHFEIIKENKAWLPQANKQRLAGVSSFGIGGTNAHVIIGDYIDPIKNHNQNKIDSSILDEEPNNLVCYVIPLSAKSRQSLQLYKQALLNYLTELDKDNLSFNIQDIAYTLQERREHFNYRSTYSAKNTIELINKLKFDTSFKETNTEHKNKIVFMFPGQGAQYIQMAKALYDNEQAFKNTIDQCIALANQHLDIDLYDVMYPEEASLHDDINETQWTQIILFIIEYGLSKYVDHLGVKADAYIGHSIGEYVAATLSAVFSLEDAIKIVIARGQLMQSMQPGSMLAINAKEEAIQSIVKKYNCEIAVINSIEDIVASGSSEDIQRLKEALDKQNIVTVPLNTSHAYHSKMMEQAAIEFERVFQHIKLNKPTKHFISNVTGEIAKEEVTTAKYWCKQLRNTVQFAKGINSLSKHFNHQINFIEVGPGKGLGYFVHKHKNANNYKSIQTIQLLPSAKETKINKDQAYQHIAYKEDIIAKLWMHNIIQQPNEIKLFKHAKLQTSLPTYQFDYQKCWLEKGDHQDSKKFNSVNDMFYERSWERGTLKTSMHNIENIKHKNVLVLVNNSDKKQNEIDTLLNLLNKYFDNISYVTHQQSNNIKPDCTFDFNNALHIKTILNEKIRTSPMDTIIYVSPSIDINDPNLDIFAIKNIFEWSKTTSNNIPKFISISFDNYDVIGNEQLQQKPSIVYGITKSIPFEYFTSGTKAFHIDLSSQDDSYEEALLPVLEQNESKDLIVIRGKYQWFPMYQKVVYLNNRNITNNDLRFSDSIFLITGGLGAIGYAYANYIVQKDKKCTIILLGRTTESNLREDYKARLAKLRKTKHHIIYAPIDIGNKDSIVALEKILATNKIETIDLILHTAGVAAKTALKEKTYDDIQQVLNPKVTGVENLIKLSSSIEINNMICCSSLSSILPSLGNMEYTAANLYLDEISYRSYSNIKSILTINLNQISDAGMAIDFMVGFATKNGISLNALKSDEFPGIVEKLLQINSVKNIALSRYDINRAYDENTKLLTDLNDKTKRKNKIKIIEDIYTETEYQIAQIFGDTLGVEQISIHDDFFKIGGNSLLAVKLISMLKKINIDISLQEVISINTTHSIYKHAQNSHKQENSIIVPLKLNNSSDRNVFFIHAVGGTVIGYKELADKLDNSYNYYGIQNINIYGDQLIKAKSLQELASIYLQEILKIQPDGCYTLGGSSMGGTLAYEIASQLQEQGKTINYVFMLDSWANFSDEFRKKDSFVKEMQRQQNEYGGMLNEADIADKNNLIEAAWGLMQLLLSYKPERLNFLPVILFKAEILNEAHATNQPSEHNGWRKYCGEITVYNTPGDHITIMEGEGLIKICTIISKKLDLVLS